MKSLLIASMVLLVSVEAWSAPYWIVNGGSNGTAERSSIGIEVGETHLIKGMVPLAAEISMNFDFNNVPSEIRFTPPQSEPFGTRKIKDGPEIGYLFKSGVNLDQWIKNLTLQVGAGYALQSEIKVATGSTSGKNWQVGERETEVRPVGYGGLLYRLERLTFSIGYNNRRGVVAGIGSSW